MSSDRFWKHVRLFYQQLNLAHDGILTVNEVSTTFPIALDAAFRTFYQPRAEEMKDMVVTQITTLYDASLQFLTELLDLQLPDDANPRAFPLSLSAFEQSYVTLLTKDQEEEVMLIDIQRSIRVLSHFSSSVSVKLQKLSTVLQSEVIKAVFAQDILQDLETPSSDAVQMENNSNTHSNLTFTIDLEAQANSLDVDATTKRYTCTLGKHDGRIVLLLFATILHHTTKLRVFRHALEIGMYPQLDHLVNPFADMTYPTPSDDEIGGHDLPTIDDLFVVYKYIVYALSYQKYAAFLVSNPEYSYRPSLLYSKQYKDSIPTTSSSHVNIYQTPTQSDHTQQQQDQSSLDAIIRSSMHMPIHHETLSVDGIIRLVISNVMQQQTTYANNNRSPISPASSTGQDHVNLASPQFIPLLISTVVDVLNQSVDPNSHQVGQPSTQTMISSTIGHKQLQPIYQALYPSIQTVPTVLPRPPAAQAIPSSLARSTARPTLENISEEESLTSTVRAHNRFPSSRMPPRHPHPHAAPVQQAHHVDLFTAEIWPSEDTQSTPPQDGNDEST